MKPRARIIVLSLLLGIAIVLPVAAHFRVKWRLEAYKAQLRAQGEKLTVAELIPAVSADELKAVVLAERIKQKGGPRTPEECRLLETAQAFRLDQARERVRPILDSFVSGAIGN